MCVMCANEKALNAASEPATYPAIQLSVHRQISRQNAHPVSVSPASSAML